MSGGGYYGGIYGGGSSEGAGAPVNYLHLLTDNFNDNSLDPAKWNTFGLTGVAETNQRLELTTDTTAAYKGIVSVASNWSLYDSHGFSNLLDAGNQALASFEVYPIHLQLNGIDTDASELFWLVTNGLIIAYYRIAGVLTFAFSAAYDPLVHKWFRIRESGGTTFWDTSVDGSTWTNQYQTANLFDYTNLEVNIFVGTWQDEGVTSTAIIDSWNILQRNFSLSGTFLLSGTVSAQPVHHSSITGTLLLSGVAQGFIQPILLAAGSKLYEYKIYDPATGDFLGRWDDVVSEFTYSQEINSAGSAIDITLARNSDSVVRGFNPLADDSNDPIVTDSNDEIAAELATTNAIGPGTTVDLNLDVKVYVFPEGGDIDGTLIFTGYISKYVSKYGRDENTIVTLFSYGAEMDNYVIEDSGDTRVPKLSKDPSVILKEVLDVFNADGGVPSYDQGGTTIDTTGSTVSYTFNVNTVLEVVKKVLELSPTDWFWYYDMALNNVHLHARPTEPDHTFVLGKHILDLNLEKYIEDLTNVVYFTGGPSPTSTDPNLFKKYTRPTSISNYRRGLQRVSDNRVTSSTSAGIIADSILDRGENPRYRSSIRIADKVYDIESIKLGDLVAFRNFGNYVDAVTMQVVRIDYHPDYVQLQLDTLLPSVPKRLEDVKRNLNQSDYAENPDAPS